MAQWAKEFVQAWEPEFDTQEQHKDKTDLRTVSSDLGVLVLNLPNN